MTLDAVEFIRRFLLHILPAGFQRLRHYGLLANRGHQAKLERCRGLLQQAVSSTPPMSPDPTAAPAPDQPALVCPGRVNAGGCAGCKPYASSPTSSPGGCSRRAGIPHNRISR
jgi:hypothetical protein